MNYPILTAELTTDPNSVGYAEMSDAETAEALNAPTRTVYRSRRVAAPDVIDELGPATARAILVALEAAAQNDPLTRVALTWLTTPNARGIDLGTGAAREMLDGFVTESVITTDQAAGLKTMAETTISRAAELGLPPVAAAHIASARN